MPPTIPALPATQQSVQNVTGTGGSDDAFHVVCAWPVSGQYGPGSRVLYYVLIVACVFGKKTEWVRNACLAAALLFPAVAALHGITLAALHVDGAVDMDLYGAFQLCSLGILAAPVIARLSRTYFLDPGRNIIFLWTGLILAGQLSLAVEFFRTSTVACHTDNNTSFTVGNFTYGTTCGLKCSIDDGPFSSMRQGAANNIYVIPAPDKLTFNTATLLTAACCIPAILSLVSMWNKILEINWATRFGATTRRSDERIDGTNATVGKMNAINAWIRFLLRAVEAPLFGGAVLTILIMGERNFFSSQVRYGTEPISSIGQWAPIVGTGLAVVGSLYMFSARALANPEKADSSSQENCNDTDSASRISIHSENTRQTVGQLPTTGSSPQRPSLSGTNTSDRDIGNRRKVAKMLSSIANYMGTAGHGQFDDSNFRREANSYPQVPGEVQRNTRLSQTEQRYNRSSDQLSRTGTSESHFEMSSPFSRPPSLLRIRSDSDPRPPEEPTNASTAAPAAQPEMTQRPRRDTLEVPSPAHVPVRAVLERSRRSTNDSG